MTKPKTQDESSPSGETADQKIEREAAAKLKADQEAEAKAKAEQDAKKIEQEAAEAQAKAEQEADARKREQAERDAREAEEEAERERARAEAEQKPSDALALEAAQNDERVLDSKGRNHDLTRQTAEDLDRQQKRDAAFADRQAGRTPEGAEFVSQQHEIVERTREERDAANAEGMAKIEEEQERLADMAHNNPNHVPTGREVDVNTPRLDKDGNKIW